MLAVLLISGALTAAVAVVALSLADSATELRVRTDVLCAGYAAAGALELGTSADDRPELVGPSVSELQVAWVAYDDDWCVVRATAHCGRAVRSRERSVDCGS